MIAIPTPSNSTASVPNFTEPSSVELALAVSVLPTVSCIYLESVSEPSAGTVVSVEICPPASAFTSFNSSLLATCKVTPLDKLETYSSKEIGLAVLFAITITVSEEGTIPSLRMVTADPSYP